MKRFTPSPKALADPYIAGFFLGLVLLAAFLVLGTGLGASSGLARFAAYLSLKVAPAHTLSSGYFGNWGSTPLDYYLVYMVLGMMAGAFLSALLGGRITPMVEKGGKASIKKRL